ncbi:MAG: hypothetical protein OHK93_001105 [Ramalina farinacea]|uniref:Uncharacterized protein n=1 Tax=Ramalina farinacea TaxID=258253 RepID=A0AA43QNU2_9LECA|nr:hypothetical protein [Ramalina farinacea]
MAPFTTAITFLALSSAVLAGNLRYERRAVTGVTGVPSSKSTVSAGIYPMTNGTIPVAGPTGTAVQSIFTSTPIQATTPATSLVVPATSAAVVGPASSPASVANAVAGTQMTDGQVNVGAAAVASAIVSSAAQPTGNEFDITEGEGDGEGEDGAAATAAGAAAAMQIVGSAAGAAAAATTCPPCPTVVVTSCPAASAAISAGPATVTVTETGPAAVTIKEMVTFTVTASLSGTEFIPTATATGNTLTSVVASKKANTVPPYPLISSFVTVGPSGTGVGTAVVGTAVGAVSGAPLASGTGR